MPSKTKESEEKVKVLKGQEAEDRVLDYIKKMNRPFGAVDVSANLKGAIPKTATQKILLALAEKKEVTQKAYGKTTLFVAKQDSLEDMPGEKLKNIEDQCKTIEDENKVIAADMKVASTELAKLKSTPTDSDLAVQVKDVATAIDTALTHLTPLRAGTPLISTTELARLDKDWTQWRAEWVKRKKVFHSLWQLATDALPPQEAAELANDLGIEYDTTEHGILERGPFCIPGVKTR